MKDLVKSRIARLKTEADSYQQTADDQFSRGESARQRAGYLERMVEEYDQECVRKEDRNDPSDPLDDARALLRECLKWPVLRVLVARRGMR